MSDCTIEPPHLAQIRMTKLLRQQLDTTLQLLRTETRPDAMHNSARVSPERTIASEKIREAIMWLGLDLKAINEENPGASPSPYPESYNPASPVCNVPADGLTM